MRALNRVKLRHRPHARNVPFGPSTIWNNAFVFSYVTLLLFALTSGACTRLSAPDSNDDRSNAEPSNEKDTGLDSGDTFFVEAATGSGLDFVHENGSRGQHDFLEMMGGGAALLDYDRDGDLDIYLTQGAMLEDLAIPGKDNGDQEATKLDDPNSGNGKVSKDEASDHLRDRLFSNQLVEDGTVSFLDRTTESGINAIGYGLGVAVGDVDNDGWPDIYVANWGQDELWRNLGDGSFEDVSDVFGMERSAWTAGASFFDFDQDGDLDLLLARYVDFSLQGDEECYAPETGNIDYCGPQSFRPQADVFLENIDGLRYEDASARVGISAIRAPGLAVAAADLNSDGHSDLYVANDGEENLLLMRQGNTFENLAVRSGAAVNLAGQAEGSMGIAMEDFDADGDFDIALTHFEGETHTFYENDGEAGFRDSTRSAGLMQSTLSATGFGIVSPDIDNDGMLDLVVANGAVIENAEQRSEGSDYPLDQVSQLFRNEGEGRFEDLSERAGSGFLEPGVGRGLAMGDIDNDGDSDLLLFQNLGRPKLLVNQIGQDQAWIGFDLRLAGSGRPAIGAELRFSVDGQFKALRRAYRDGSYASSSDPRILIGLGSEGSSADTANKIDIRWPDGTHESWADLQLGMYHSLVQGQSSSK